MAAENGKHSRHNLGNSEVRAERSAKHRYVYIHGTKPQKKLLRQNLRYEVCAFPKSPTHNYDSGGVVPTQDLLFA